MQRSRSFLLPLILAICLIGVGITLGGALAQTNAPVLQSPSTPMDAQAVVRQTSGAVVSVINEQTTPQQLPGAGSSQDQSQSPGLQPVGVGTGFFIDPQGHIATNEHVVHGGESFQVILASGEKRPATLVGADPLSDLAVIQVDGDVPATLSFGDSDQVQVGAPVLAIGSSLGDFTGTVTDGIIGAVGRDFPMQPGMAAYANLLQHDAPINPGNSGGPLVDAQGEVIGVNTLGINQVPEAGPVQGLFFAIPSNVVSQIVTKLVDSGQVTYPYLGAQIEEVTPDVASQYDLPVDYGAYVASVEPDSPAAQAGIQQGDVITALGGQSLDNQTRFSELLFTHQPGEQVAVTLQRDGSSQDVTVTLGTRPTEA